MRKNKTWEITLTDNSRLVANEPIENAVVYTTDTEAYLNFRVIDSGFDFDSATIAMLNKDDGSIVERPMTKEVETAVYEIESDIIPHFGLWQAQVLFKQGEEVFTSTPVKFVVERYMGAEQPPRLEDVVSWKRLYDNATETMLELIRINDELTNANEVIQQAEVQRVLAENERSEKYESYAQQFDDVIAELSEEKDYASLPEIASARGGHDTLGQRLDETTAQLAQTIPKNSGAVRPSDLSQEVKTQMTGGSVAVVGEDTILEENIVDKQITPRKTTFAHTSRNLYNKKTTIDYKFFSGDSLVYTTTDYMAVNPNTIHVFNKDTRLILYNGDYQPIGSQYVLSVGDTISTSNATRYVRIAIPMSDKDDYQFEEGTVPTSYQPYGILIPDLAIEGNGLERYLTTQDEGWTI